ncbi:MAG: P1 family peptidase [Alphaproteobacteria bacterium]|nr:P1 family peptidase [Alphaproteobacteria bacterium]
MIRKGARNLITDVDGLRVGQAEDFAIRTGVTVLLCDKPSAAAADVRGGAPGMRDVMLDPTSLVGELDAIVLSGGSAFGLDAPSGVQAWLRDQGRGFQIAPGTPRVPIVSGAILFDLANGGNKDWGEMPPYRALGRTAVETAGEDFVLGNAGAGLGATAGQYKGGIGSASSTGDDFTVGALVAVNSVGSPVVPGTDVFWAFPFEQDGEFGGRLPQGSLPAMDLDLPADMKGAVQPAGNTTIAIVATDVVLTRAELQRVAVMAADGFARALRPAHTPFDGDLVFAVSTARRDLAGPRPVGVMRLGHVAADCLARAIARGVYEAETLGAVKSYRDVFRPA